MRLFVPALLCLLSLNACGGSNAKESASSDNVDAVIATELGEIAINLYDQTPLHRDNFLKLAREDYFDSMVFHRIIYEFMIQTGDPRTRKGWPRIDTTQDDGPGYTLSAEFGPHSVHIPGRLGAARQPDEKNPDRRSAGSQFYIIAEGDPIPAQVIDSMEAVYTAQLRGQQYERYRQLVDSSGYEASFNQYLNEQHFETWQYPPTARQAYRETGGAPWLDFTYTVFGEVISGMEVVNRINTAATDTFNRPTKPIRILDVRIPSP